jgi:selenocysteine lyase/cysteine desulfurase
MRTAQPTTGHAEPHADLLRYRDDFPIVRNKTFLNTCSLGALSTRSMANIQEYMDMWAEFGASAWYRTWMGKMDELRAAYGRVVGAPQDRIALGPSISATVASVTSAIDFSKRKKIVTTDLDFPTVGHSFLAKQRDGVRVEFLRSPDHITVPLDLFEQAIDEDTALVCTSHVYFTSGAIQDIAAIAKMARAKGALFLVDAYHGTGHVPTDVVAADLDFYTSGSLKWLLGGSGTTFLYVSERNRDMEPALAGWFGMGNMFDFDINSLQWREDARRFEMGTPSMASVYAALGGISYIEEIGVQAIRERDIFLTEDLIERARLAGFSARVVPNPEERTAIVLLNFDDPRRLVSALAQEGIVVDYRPGAVRISPYFYNSVEENERVVAALKKLA